MNDTTKRKILVTGGAGNVGSALVQGLLRDPRNEVTILDDLSTGSRHKLPSNGEGRWRLIKADVNRHEELSAVMVSHRFDFAFHYAAVVGVQRTLANPMAVLKDIDGIRNLLELAKNTGVRRVFYSSSSEVYGEPFELPQHEHTTPLNSRLPYAVVKNVGEAFFRSVEREYGLEYTIFRFFNTYGPNQSEDFVLPRFLRAPLRGNDITIYGDGSQTRTFCYVDDNVDTALACLDRGEARNDVINVGNDEEITILDLARLILEVTGSRSKVVHLPPLSEGDMSRRRPDLAKMRGIIKRDLVPLRTGVERLARLWSEPTVAPR